MDAKKAIEEGRGYLLVMTDRRMKPDEADAKKMQKIESSLKRLRGRNFRVPNKRRESGSSEGVQEQVPKKYNKNESVDSWGLLIGSSGENQEKLRFELGIIRNYTMKSLILAQDER